jgi:uncharacterized membrane protein
MVTVAKIDDKASIGREVPTVTVAVAYLLLIMSLVSLVAYVHHAGQSLRVAGLIDLVGDNLQTEIDRMFPTQPPAEDPWTITAADAGVVVGIDEPGLVAAARRTEGWLEMLVGMGDFVPRDGPMIRCHGDIPPNRRTIRSMVLLDNERTHIGDPGYGLRKLVDIAERSIASSPYDDPTTAVQAIDRLHDGLRQLAFRQLPSGQHRDAAGDLRLMTRELAWHGYVALAFDELIDVGSESPLVARRLLAALDDLVAVAPLTRRAPLESRRGRLLSRASEARLRLEPDLQGLGSSEELTNDPSESRHRTDR